MKASDKYIKNCNKNKESSDLNYWYVNNLYGWANLKKLPVDGFEQVEDTFHFNEEFQKPIMKIIMQDILLRQYSENCMNFIMIDPFYLKE